MSWLKKFWKPLTWLIAVALVAYVFAITPFTDIIEIFGRLTILQIGGLALVNIVIVILFGLRWWWLLRSQGHCIPFLAIVRYRLAAFGVSYFTPGPQFGGEPLQIYFLRNKHHIPTADALSSLSLDKLFELLSNFTFLAIGIIYIFSGGFLELGENVALLALIAVLAILPWGYLVLLFFSVKPITQAAKTLCSLKPDNKKLQAISDTIRESESQIASYCQSNTLGMVGIMFLSGIVWLVLVFEYWLALRFLGVEIAFGNTMVFITAARLAFLTPLPGGLGSLEISQVIAAGALGIGTEVGASIGLLIRIRDIVFGLIGLLWGGILTRRF
ncbi:MAG: flippase-like domain-containing protein [Anaerolineales bacterium]|nr:flippase-like domain-containing protein [Chloroflexota bacterium]MBL6981912.1 flippase-like domain-containing protein [Anaerolineales bacterium]